MDPTTKNKENLELGTSEYNENMSTVIYSVPEKRDISWMIFKLIMFILALVITVIFSIVDI